MNTYGKIAQNDTYEDFLFQPQRKKADASP